MSRATDPAPPEQNGENLAGFLGDIERLEIIFATWDETARGTVVAYRRAIDAPCAASILTFHAGVKKAVQEACPEITDVVEVRAAASTGMARFTSPFAIKAAGPWRAAGALADIPDEGVRGLDLDGVPVLLFRRGTAVTCFQDACAHLGSPLRDGTLDAGIITCPHHGFRYDLANGECLTAAEVQLQPHAVRVVAGLVEVRIAA